MKLILALRLLNILKFTKVYLKYKIYLQKLNESKFF